MKLLLIDGHYYVYRSFFAIPNLSNSRGEPTNAIFGFTKTLRLMLKHLQPQLGAVFWDEGLPQRRVELQPAYKETRKEMPRPMIPQLDFIRSTITPLLGFTNVALPGFGMLVKFVNCAFDTSAIQASTMPGVTPSVTLDVATSGKPHVRLVSFACPDAMST